MTRSIPRRPVAARGPRPSPGAWEPLEWKQLQALTAIARADYLVQDDHTIRIEASSVSSLLSRTTLRLSRQVDRLEANLGPVSTL